MLEMQATTKFDLSLFILRHRISVLLKHFTLELLGLFPGLCSKLKLYVLADVMETIPELI